MAAGVERQAEDADAAGGPDRSPESPGGLVVVSAMGGVTNTLFDAAQAGLQTVDYFVWALQRPFERHSKRYVTYQLPAFRLVQDVGDRGMAGHGMYDAQKKPLNAAALEWRQEKKTPGI